MPPKKVAPKKAAKKEATSAPPAAGKKRPTKKSVPASANAVPEEVTIKGDGYTLKGPMTGTFVGLWFLFREAHGDFSEVAPATWRGFFTDVMPTISKIRYPYSRRSFIKIAPEGQPNTYRAGVTYASKTWFNKIDPAALNIQVEKVMGRKYAMFTLVGGYEHLGEAWEKAREVLKAAGVEVDDEQMHNECYNSEEGTPAEKTETEIFIAIK